MFKRFSISVLIEDTGINKQMHVMQIKRNLLKISTGRRLTSWLLTKRGGVESGTTKHKSIQWQGGGFELGTSGLQIQRPSH